MRFLSMTKGKAYVMCFCGIMVIFFAGFSAGVILQDSALIPAALCLTALVTVTGGYIGLQVHNNRVKGDHWNQGMWDSENPEGGEEKKMKGEEV